jgi:N-sulfoglucosamine sulfohydrolase
MSSVSTNRCDFISILILNFMGLAVTRLLAGGGRVFYRRKQDETDEVHRVRSGRNFLVLVLSLVFLFTLVLSAAGASAAKPNILFFIGDDWGRNASCYRDPARPGINDVITTPNIDRLAGEGVLFRNAFMNVASCTPSRASIVTGCYFWRLGQNAFHRPDPGWEETTDPGWALPGLGSLLQLQNYFLGSSGKTLNRHWFRATRAPFDIYKPRYSEWVPTQPNRATAEKELEAIFRGSVTSMLAKRKKGQPFCHIIGPISAHRPFSKGSGKRLWGINPDDLKRKLPAFLPDVPEAREDMADTLGEVLATDLYIGWIVDELRKAGELDNTLLVLTGDNGINMPHGKAQVYDLGVRAPLIIRWPGGIAKSGRVVDDFVSLVDLAPTFLEVAGAIPPTGMDGRSLLPLLKSDKSGQIDPTRDFVVTGRERHEPDARADRAPYPVRAIRTADFLYVRNFKPERWPCGDPADPGFPSDPKPRGSGTIEWIVSHKDDPQGSAFFAIHYGRRPAEELYDLRKDPDQVKNVALDPAYARAKNSLSERLMKVLRDTGDPRLTDAFDRPPYYLGPAPAKTPKNKATNIEDPDCIEHVNGD